MTRNIAAILAGGVGERTGLHIPKQFITLCGRTVLERSIDAFENNDNISGIIVVSSADHLEHVRNIVKRNNWQKIQKIIIGGKERRHSTLAAIKSCNEMDCNILLHDAARPLVSQRIINDVCACLEHSVAVNVAIPSTDSLVEVCDKRMIRSVERATIWRVQTPQAFYIETIRQAYKLAAEDQNFFATDDCSVVKNCLPQTNVAVVRGEETNIKLTYADDVAIMENIISRKKL